MKNLAIVCGLALALCAAAVVAVDLEASNVVTSETHRAASQKHAPTEAYGWYTRSGGIETNAYSNVRQLVIRWNGVTIYDGPGVSNGQPVVVSGFSYYPSTYRSDSLYGWSNDHNNAFDIYRTHVDKAVADCMAAAEAKATSETHRAVSQKHAPTEAYGWYTRSGGIETNAYSNVRQLVIRWNGVTIYDGPGVSNGQPVVVSGFSYYPSTYRSDSLYGWSNDHNNAFDIYRKSSDKAAAEKAIADCKAAAESAEVAKKALAASSGNYKGLFAEMMKHVKSDMNSMKTDVESEFKAITSKRDSVAAVLADRTAMAKEKEKTYSDAISALRAADQACTSTTNTAIASASTLKAVTASLNSRNPVIEKELAVLRQLVAKVAELKSINLQESSGHEDARSSAYQQTRDMIESLQTFESEAAPLSEMIEIAREHAEFTQPIVKLLQELEAKLLAEQNSLRAEVSSADKANTLAQASASSTCQQKEAKKVEECVFFCEFAHVIF
jgi:hypothetical protein